MAVNVGMYYITVKETENGQKKFVQNDTISTLSVSNDPA